MSNLSNITVKNIETEECSERDIKVGIEFIMQVRAEAERQKAKRSIKSFLDVVADKDRSLSAVESEAEMDSISEDFEITEE